MARYFTVLWLIFVSFLSGAWGQEFELLQGQAGLYPLRATLREPAAVGPAHLVVELGQPKELFKLPPSQHTPAPREEPPAKPRELAVSVVLEMPDMPSAKPTSVKLTSTAPNRFEGDVLITMKGDWRAQFVVQTPQGEFRPLARFKVGSGSVSGKTAQGGLELCDPDQSENIPLTIRSFPEQPRVGKNLLRIELPGDVTMPVMVGVSMPGSAVGIPPREAVRQEDGSYQALIHLPMAGYWQVRVDLNGRALPPFALTVEQTDTPGENRALLPLIGGALVPILLWVFWRRRGHFKPVLAGAVLLLGTVALGAAIETAWPSRHSMEMEMDMLAFDMGLGHLTAPLPVLESKLVKTPFVTTKSYSAVVGPQRQNLVRSSRSGVLSELTRVGSYVSSGATVASVGSQKVMSAFGGVVVQTLLTDGATVSPGDPILSVSPTETVLARAWVPLSDRDMLVPGMPIEVVGRDGQRAKGKLTRVSAVSDGRGVEVEAVVDNVRPRDSAHGLPAQRFSTTPAVALRRFAIGESVRLKVTVEGPRSSISVPREAVRETAQGQTHVFLVSQVAGQRVARAQQVSLGVVNETHVEVLNGLSEGQVIVAKLEPSLKDGDLVVRAALGEGVYRSLVVPGDGSH